MGTLEVYHPLGVDPRGRPGMPSRDSISQTAWEHRGVSLEELEEVAGGNGTPGLRLYPPYCHRNQKWRTGFKKMDAWTDSKKCFNQKRCHQSWQHEWKCKNVFEVKITNTARGDKNINATFFLMLFNECINGCKHRNKWHLILVFEFTVS